MYFDCVDMRLSVINVAGNRLHLSILTLNGLVERKKILKIRYVDRCCCIANLVLMCRIDSGRTKETRLKHIMDVDVEQREKSICSKTARKTIQILPRETFCIQHTKLASKRMWKSNCFNLATNLVRLMPRCFCFNNYNNYGHLAYRIAKLGVRSIKTILN